MGAWQHVVLVKHSHAGRAIYGSHSDGDHVVSCALELNRSCFDVQQTCGGDLINHFIAPFSVLLHVKRIQAARSIRCKPILSIGCEIAIVDIAIDGH